MLGLTEGHHMEFTFPWPTSNGEWMAFGSAAVTVLLGLIRLFVPGIVLRVQKLQPVPDHPEAMAAVRATMAGFHLGLGTCSLLLAQPLIYMTLGFSWAFTAFGRLISMLSDRGGTLLNVLWLVVELALAALALGYSLGFVP
jgi:Domain of unknown function (DUF4345)